MSIDGIGKPSGVAPSASAPEARPAQTSFEVGEASSSSSSSSAAAAAATAAGSDAFLALERGELSVAEYLNARVDSAVAPLLGKLSPEQLDFVRTELRSALETDPVLVELVRKTTGDAVSGR